MISYGPLSMTKYWILGSAKSGLIALGPAYSLSFSLLLLLWLEV